MSPSISGSKSIDDRQPMDGDTPDGLHNSEELDGSPDGSGGPTLRRQSTTGDKNKKQGTRTLTNEQLEKKRANDREAQRAIRERTKKQIEALEQRIRDLESGEAYRQLQETLKQRDAVEAENVELKRRLGQVYGILQPLAGVLGGAANYPQQQQQVTLPYGAPAPTPDFNQDPRLPLAPSSDLSKRYGDGQNSLPLNNPAPAPFQMVNGHDSLYRRALAMGNPWERQEPTSPYTPDPPPSHQRHPPDPYYNSQEELERSVKRQRRKNDIGTSAPANNQLGPSVTSDQQPQRPFATNIPIQAQLPNNIRPTCRFDTILFDYASSARRRIADGASLHDIIGPDYPIFNSMVDPANPSTSSMMQYHSLSELLVELLKGFSAITGLPEKIATISQMFYFMRWYIHPCVETHSAIPAWNLPTDEQLRIAHPIWIEYLPWPKIRSKMVYHYPQLPLDNFFYPYSTTLSLHFERSDEHCLFRDPNGEIRVRPEMEAHWRDLESWSLGPFFAESLPMLAETCKIRTGRKEEGREA